MAWNFCKGKTISKQIADKIAIDILTGAILPAQRLPSLEDMSKITGVSAKVVAESYAELVADGIVIKDKLFIISSDLTGARRRRDKLAREAALKLNSDLSALGLTRTEQLKLFGELVIEQSKEQEVIKEEA